MREWGPIIGIIPFLGLCLFALIAAVFAYRVSPKEPISLSGPIKLPLFGKEISEIRVNAGGAVAAFLITLIILRALVPAEVISYEAFCGPDKTGMQLWEIHIPVKIYSSEGALLGDYEVTTDNIDVTLTPKFREVAPDKTLIITYPLTAEDVLRQNLPKLHVGLQDRVKHHQDHIDLDEVQLVPLGGQKLQVAEPISIQLLPEPPASDVYDTSLRISSEPPQEFEQLPGFQRPEDSE